MRLPTSCVCLCLLVAASAGAQEPEPRPRTDAVESHRQALRTPVRGAAARDAYTYTFSGTTNGAR